MFLGTFSLIFYLFSLVMILDIGSFKLNPANHPHVKSFCSDLKYDFLHLIFQIGWDKLESRRRWAITDPASQRGQEPQIPWRLRWPTQGVHNATVLPGHVLQEGPIWLLGWWPLGPLRLLAEPAQTRCRSLPVRLLRRFRRGWAGPRGTGRWEDHIQAGATVEPSQFAATAARCWQTVAQNSERVSRRSHADNFAIGEPRQPPARRVDRGRKGPTNSYTDQSM